MIPIKTQVEIEMMKQGGKILKRVMEKVLREIKPGVRVSDLDELADREIVRLGAQPAFKQVKDYQWATCISLNDEVVHGIPTRRVIQEGDIVGIDTGVFYKGFNTDASWTVIVHSAKNKVQSKENQEFLEAGEEALEEAIDQVRPGKRIVDISKAINDIIIKAGYSPVRALTGHGVGRKLHEEPLIPCFWDSGDQDKPSPEIQPGMVFAIEVIYNQGMADVVMADDGWTIKTKDGKISALFEKTVAVTADGPLILTE